MLEVVEPDMPQASFHSRSSRSSAGRKPMEGSEAAVAALRRPPELRFTESDPIGYYDLARLCFWPVFFSREPISTRYVLDNPEWTCRAPLIAGN